MIERMNMLEMSIPHDCLWCAYSGIIMNAEDRIEAVACMHYSTRKTQKKDAPSNREYRTYLKIMGSMETCEHCTPIKLNSDKMKLMKQLGLTDGWY